MTTPPLPFGSSKSPAFGQQAASPFGPPNSPFGTFKVPSSNPFAPPSTAPAFPATASSSIKSVANLSTNMQAKQWAKAVGLDIANVAWEDCARTPKSCWGPCISDMTLVVNKTWMSVLRPPNFSDPIMRIPAASIQVRVGNESPHDVPLTNVSLQHYLEHIAKYTELESSLFAPGVDDQVLVSAQSCFLPIPMTGHVDFHVGLYNYQSTPSSPAVLVLVSTDAGTSAQVVRGDRQGDILYFNDRGTKRTFNATRLSTDRAARGVTTTGAMTQDEDARNFIMVVQIPLRVVQPRFGGSSFSFGGGGQAFGCSPAAPSYMPTSSTGFANFAAPNVEPAMVGLGSAVGPFPKLSQHAKIERDTAYPIRVTLQFYQATTNGVVSEAIIQHLAAQMAAVKTHATWTGSLVQPQPSWSCPTSSSGPFVPTVAAAASTASSPHKAFYCNQCSQLITGRIRYKCLVCPDFDLCETCEGVESTHPTHHPFLRLKHAHYGNKNYVTLNRQELTHHGVHCCECNQPIVGILYQCTLCPTVRLCESCELVAGHADFTHPLLKIFRSQKLSTKTS
ncbi:Aste57867_17193 [Aphanomyces stellatus]|uniref:Aste57867_17193 protein n=1 Tax=Aphanomyces stellatus TaxID=120398 RepID=A0A485LAT7_9STRA|nr:hypothetical protein As57867_017134 [Aphanomyces stellatus]VFT93950.1 Aste57867_17193 [Aphanomyces stellatus]